MELMEYDYASFRERMDQARDAKPHPDCRLRAVVSWKRPARYQTVEDAAARLGVSVRRVRALCDQRRIPGVIQRRSLKGKPYLIPRDAVPIPGSRGPKSRSITGLERAVPLSTPDLPF